MEKLNRLHSLDMHYSGNTCTQERFDRVMSWLELMQGMTSAALNAEFNLLFRHRTFRRVVVRTHLTCECALAVKYSHKISNSLDLGGCVEDVAYP